MLLAIGSAVCNHVHSSLQKQDTERLSAVYKEDATDTIYQIDRDVEEIIIPLITPYAKELGGLVLMAEGIGDPDHGVVLPESMPADEAALRIIMNPIDGTRGIMYDKRSAFYLAAAAPNKGTDTRLSDIEVAVMTELPTSRSVLSDRLWAVKGKEVAAQTVNIATGDTKNWTPRPSQADTLLGGFAQIARFFPPGRALLAHIDDTLLSRLYPDADQTKTIVFEDQYISSGGQAYEMLRGHDRFIADIRAGLFRKVKAKGGKTGHTCHPYDVCAFLIGQECGVVFTDLHGNAFDAPFSLTYPVDWIAYANQNLKEQIAPVFHQILKEEGLV